MPGRIRLIEAPSQEIFSGLVTKPPLLFVLGAERWGKGRRHINGEPHDPCRVWHSASASWQRPGSQPPAQQGRRVGQAHGGVGHRREGGRQGGEGDGRRGDARARAGGRPAPPPRSGLRVRARGRVRVGDRRQACQGPQGRRDVLRAGREPAPGVEEPGQGEDPPAGVGHPPAGRQGHRRPGPRSTES